MYHQCLFIIIIFIASTLAGTPIYIESFLTNDKCSGNPIQVGLIEHDRCYPYISGTAQKWTTNNTHVNAYMCETGCGQQCRIGKTYTIPNCEGFMNISSRVRLGVPPRMTPKGFYMKMYLDNACTSNNMMMEAVITDAWCQEGREHKDWRRISWSDELKAVILEIFPLEGCRGNLIRTLKVDPNTCFKPEGNWYPFVGVPTIFSKTK